MLKVTHACEDHGNAKFVAGVDDFLIADAPAWLDDRRDPGCSSHFDVVCKWEERIAGKHRTLGLVAGMLERNVAAADAVHLASADADGHAVLGNDDGVGFDMLDDLPCKQQLFDLFRCVCGSDLQEAFLEWFYSYREYSKFCLQYLILRPFDNASDEEFKQRLNRLSEWQRLTYRLQFAEQLEEVRWLYIALCEKMNERQEKLQTPPSHPDEKKVQKEAERIARRLGMTAEEYVNGRFLPKLYKRLGKRYEDFRRKYQNVAVIEEDDPRPVREQIVSIFGEGPEPRFRNPEFEDKDGKKGS